MCKGFSLGGERDGEKRNIKDPQFLLPSRFLSFFSSTNFSILLLQSTHLGAWSALEDMSIAHLCMHVVDSHGVVPQTLPMHGSRDPLLRASYPLLASSFFLFLSIQAMNRSITRLRYKPRGTYLCMHHARVHQHNRVWMQDPNWWMLVVLKS
jgi:hypothetical protein